MRSWPVQDAKARFSELLNACLRDGPQVVSRRGTDTAVLVPLDEWERLQRRTKPTLKDLLLDDAKRFDLDLPPRTRLGRRMPPDMD